MKKATFYLLATFMAVTMGFAQERAQQPIGSNFAFGFQVGQYQDNFGIGLNVTSPYFAKKYVAVRLRGNLMWNDHILNGESTWSSYTNMSIGFVGVAGEIGNFMRVYGEGGIILLFPNADFSSESMENGGYGLFGFEFFFDPHFNYFLEVGGVGTGAIADKVVGKPIYSNGLLINVGFRVQL